MKNGKYMKREVLNLARFISVMKFRPLSWRMAHPYLLTDRLEVQPALLCYTSQLALAWLRRYVQHSIAP